MNIDDEYSNFDLYAFMPIFNETIIILAKKDQCGYHQLKEEIIDELSCGEFVKTFNVLTEMGYNNFVFLEFIINNLCLKETLLGPMMNIFMNYLYENIEESEWLEENIT